ncbi:MAG: NACHT domain-containing protein [Saprospiraceae bacterium]
MESLNKRIKNLIANSEIDTALGSLLKLEQIDDELQNVLIILSGRLEALKTKKIKGIIGEEDFSLEENRIADSLLEFLKKLPSEEKLLSRKREIIGEKFGISAKMVNEIYTNLELQYKERLRQKLEYRFAISLTLNYTQAGTTPEFAETFFENRDASNPEYNISKLLENFRHLLIIGEPGVGKTTFLLQIALDWLQRNDELIIPILFDLGTWKNEETTFMIWLETALVSGYGFSKKFAQISLKKNMIFPILDGLDEIGKSYSSNESGKQARIDCLESIDKFIVESDIRNLIISCRKIDYEEISQNAPVRAEVILNSLKPEYLYEELKNSMNGKLTNRQTNVVKKTLSIFNSENEKLISVLCNPFYFNLAFDTDAFIYTSKNFAQLPSEVNDIKSYLFKQFIAEKLLNKSRFPKKKSIAYLSWIAHWLENHKLISFELSDFQPNDLKSPRLMTFIGSLLFGLISGFVIGFFQQFILHAFNWNIILLNAIWFSIAFGAIYGIIGLFRNSKVQTEDIMKFDWDRLKSFSTYKTIYDFASKRAAIWGGSFGIIFGILYGITPNLFQEFSDGKNLSFSLVILQFFLFGGLIGIIEGSIRGFFKEIISISFFSSIKHPYYRLTRGLFFKFTQFILIVFFFFLIVGYQVKLSISEWRGYLGMGIILFSLLIVYNTPIVKHFILRLGFYFEKRLPIRLVNFLNYATDARILEKIGGKWRFRHQFIKNWFLERTDEYRRLEEEKLSPKRR